MADLNKAWDPKIIASMEPGSVTFSWDDGRIQSIPAPEGTLESMQKAWEWVEQKVKSFETAGDKPRTVCFRLSSGQFRGLRYPDWKPGVMD
jgi:hypothetical protein